MKSEHIFATLLIIVIAAIAIIAIAFNPQPIAVGNSRITLKAETTINEHGYRIIEVDSVEYICSPNGICPLVKK